METADFIARDYTWDIQKAGFGKLSHYRLSDNYLRFYLKCIEPNKTLIRQGNFGRDRLTQFSQWQGILGLQFENLVLSNRALIKSKLKLGADVVLIDGPFFQTTTNKQAGCQIDYLVQTQWHNLFVCEIKFSTQPIGVNVIAEMEQKIACFSRPKRFSCHPVLIHVSGVSDAVIAAGYFSHIIDLREDL